MGLFYNYNKPGKGVEKDEPKKKGIALFWELLRRKFFSYIKLNFIYAITCFPAIILIWIFLTQTLQDLAQAQTPEMISAIGILALVLSVFIAMCFSLSPFSAGYYYVLRNFVRENHSWVFSDFCQQTGANIKQTIAMYIIDLIFVLMSIFVFRIYFILSVAGVLAIQIMSVVYLIAVILYSASTPYKWTMMCTFKLNFFQIIKNSLLLVCGEFGKTLIYLATTLVYLVVLYLLFVNFTYFAALLMLLLGFSMFGLIQEINILPVMEKHMMPKDEQ